MGKYRETIHFFTEINIRRFQNSPWKYFSKNLAETEFAEVERTAQGCQIKSEVNASLPIELDHKHIKNG